MLSSSHMLLFLRISFIISSLSYSQRMTSMSVAWTFPVFAISTLIGMDSPTSAELTSVVADLTTRSGARRLMVTIFSLVSNKSPTHDGESSWSPPSSALPIIETTLSPKLRVSNSALGSTATIATMVYVSYGAISGKRHSSISDKYTQLSSGKDVSVDDMTTQSSSLSRSSPT